MESHESTEAIERAWRDGLTPDPLLTVSEWADRYRVLSQRASSEPGRWRTARTPYLREIMDCLSPSSPYQRVAFMKGAQIGGSECGTISLHSSFTRRRGR
jgi:phage terminase large subunit GpA-like protein